MGEQQDKWEGLTAAGAEAYRNGAEREALAVWRQAAALAEDYLLQDPRRAAAMSNLALLAYLEGNVIEARGRWSVCDQLWQEALGRIAGLSLRSPARSSHFHLHLEQRHGEEFQVLLRKGLTRVMEGAVAVTRFNFSMASLQVDGDSETGLPAATAAIDLRREAWGPRSPELAEMLRGLASFVGDGTASLEAESLLREAWKIEEEPARSAQEIWADECMKYEGAERNYRAASRFTLHLTEPALLRQ